MASVKICDNRMQLFQWDTGVQLELCECEKANELHFVTATGIIKRDVVDGICDVPDVALQQAGLLVIFAFTRDGEGGSTRHEFRLRVVARPKPADYIDPPDEIDNVDAIYERIKDEIVGPQGEKGDTGQRGKGFFAILSKPSKNVGIVDGWVHSYSLALSLIQSETGLDEIFVGDHLVYQGAYVYPVIYVDKYNVYFDAMADLHGLQGEKGDPGNDGTSISHQWDGTTLQITSASGTSSADLKGSQGVAGDPGADGRDGTSVTITSITESTEDGGNNVVTFSDGKTLNVKNGSKGEPGEVSTDGSECECKRITGTYYNSVLTLNKTIEEIVAIGEEELREYDFKILYFEYVYTLSGCSETNGTLNIYLSHRQLKYTHDLLISINTSNYSYYVNTYTQHHPEIPTSTASWDYGKVLTLRQDGYVLEEPASSTPMIMVAETDGALVSEGVTPEVLLEAYNDDFPLLKMIVINETTMEIKAFSFVYVDAANMTIDFANGTGTMVHMASDGSLSYVQ